MSILAKILQTEKQIQNQLVSAREESEKIKSGLIEEGHITAKTIAEQTAKEIAEIEDKKKKELNSIDERLEKILKDQENEINNSVKDKKQAIINKMYEEAMNI